MMVPSDSGRLLGSGSLHTSTSTKLCAPAVLNMSSLKMALPDGDVTCDARTSIEMCQHSSAARLAPQVLMHGGIAQDRRSVIG